VIDQSLRVIEMSYNTRSKVATDVHLQRSGMPTAPANLPVLTPLTNTCTDDADYGGDSIESSHTELARPGNLVNSMEENNGSTASGTSLTVVDAPPPPRRRHSRTCCH